MNRAASERRPRPEAVGRVLVVGGGIGGIQCALDLAEAGFFVYLLDENHSLGGTMAKPDKTFPTNDCSTCMFSPKLVTVAGHPNIEILPGSRLLALDGDPGRFSARIETRPRYVDTEKCIACGMCAEKCPKKVSDPFNESLSSRKAAFVTFPQAVPLKYALDPDHCLYLTRKKCGLCKKICPTGAVDFEQEGTTRALSVGAVVLATGLAPALTTEYGEYGFGRYRNVVSSLQYERMLSATGPYSGHLVRPSDGKAPGRVAWIQCVLSRDAARNRPFCSSVCCMHAAKQAAMTRDHLPGSEAVIYFMDIRAHGKGFDDYIERARHRHGVQYRRSMISQVYLDPSTENLIIETFDHKRHEKREEEYDLVVLSSGLKPSDSWRDLAGRLGLAPNRFGFLPGAWDEPVFSGRPGVFVVGGTETPKDIPETVVQASAAAAGVSALLWTARHENVVRQETVEERAVAGSPRVGVFICHCGSNIAGVVRIPELLEKVGRLTEVVLATDFMFTCAAETQDKLLSLIAEHDLNRVVVAACSPKTHEPLFRETLQKAGLNPYLFAMANIRNQCSWVHGNDPDAATEKAFGLVQAAVARARRLSPLTDRSYPVINTALVVGGGVSGMAAALAVADQGYPAHLVEQSDRLGGFALHLTETLEGDSPPKLVRRLEARIRRHPNVTLHLQSRLVSHQGYAGRFEGEIETPQGLQQFEYGAVIVATGGRAYEPVEYRNEKDDRILTQVELSRRMQLEPDWVKGLNQVVMLQCVGSRNEEFGFCSRVCCAAAVKNAIRLKEINPEIQVAVLYRDLRTFGFKELFFLEARKKGVLFFRFDVDRPPEIRRGEEGVYTVDFTDRSEGKDYRIEADLVALSSGIRPHPDAGQVAELLKLPRTAEGFFMEAHVKLQPLEFSSPGIFLAGLAHSPRFVSESIGMALGAAQQAVKILSRVEMTTPATVAEVDEERCTACLACVRVCPFSAPFINERGISEIPPPKCRGCGICPAE